MISKTLGFLGGLVGLASGQYVNHHQQWFQGSNSFLVNRTEVFDTKALTPVAKKGQKKLRWAFTATKDYNTGSGANNYSQLRVLLVKLKENTNAIPFELDWVREYYVPGRFTRLDVEDVYYVSRGKRKGYILCGTKLQYVNPGLYSYEGWLLRTDVNGNIISKKLYPEVERFMSVVPWHNRNGFIAVGTSQKDVDGKRDAVYMSVNKDLDVVCASRMAGVFAQAPTSVVDSGFNKVIQYQRSTKKLFAVTGYTAANFNDDCQKNNDVLVSLVDKKCNVEFVSKYGSEGNSQTSQKINERGLSIAQFSNQDGGLVITGSTKAQICDQIEFYDILAFRINEDGTVVNWMGHYSVENNTPSLFDTGYAVQMSTGPGEQTVLVAGESETKEFDNLDRDTVLLELNKDTGDVDVLDIFGLYSGFNINTGALYTSPSISRGGNLDLHLTDDHHAVIMGNVDDLNSDPGFRPHLIERYTTRQEKCVDVRTQIPKETYTFPVDEAWHEEMEVKAEFLDLRMEKGVLYQHVVCEKEEFITESPSVSPSKDPSESPTTEVPSAGPSSCDCTCEPTEAPDSDPTPEPIGILTLAPYGKPIGWQTIPPIQTLAPFNNYWEIAPDVENGPDKYYSPPHLDNDKSSVPSECLKGCFETAYVPAECIEGCFQKSTARTDECLKDCFYTNCIRSCFGRDNHLGGR